MITATDRQRDKIDAMIAYGENRGHERGLAQGIEQGIERGLAQGEQRAQSRLAEIMRRHPEADHQTILRLMAEADD